jgi:hypothetical protein
VAQPPLPTTWPAPPPSTTQDPRIGVLAATPVLPLELAPYAGELLQAAQAATGAGVSSGIKAAWVLWAQYMAKIGLTATISLCHPLFDSYLAGYAIFLANGHLGRKYAPGTIEQYLAYVRSTLGAGTPAYLLDRVRKGIPRLAKPRPPPVEVSLHQLTTIMTDARAQGAPADLTQTGLMSGYLTCTVSRSQSACTRNVEGLQQGATLLCCDVQPSSTRTFLRAASRMNKGDTTGKRLGPDGANWQYWWCREGSPLDGMSLYDKHVANLRAAGTYHPDAPFFQETFRGVPTGRPLNYSGALRNFRKHFAARFPGLALAGFHALRRLGVTVAYLKGLPTDLIMQLGGWSSLTFQRYLTLSEEDRVTMSRHIVESEVRPLTIAPLSGHTRALHVMAPIRHR